MRLVPGTCLLTGTGGSSGVPVIGCRCATCQSKHPRNQRLRSAAVVRIEDTVILIDAGPDLRQQALRYQIDHVDGVVLTHVHYDHTAGIDDLRAYYFQKRKPLLCLASTATAEDITGRCAYLFQPPEERRSLTAQIAFQLLHESRGDVDFLGYRLRYFSFEQGGMPVNGFRWGSFAYVSDIKEYPQTIFDDLAGVEQLVVSALRQEPSFLHFSIDDAVCFAERTGAKQVYLTHLAHEVEYEATNAKLPPHIRCGYDGIEIPFTAEEV